MGYGINDLNGRTFNDLQSSINKLKIDLNFLIKLLKDLQLKS